MNEARRLQYLQVETSEEAALLVTSFKKLSTRRIEIGSSNYRLILSQAGLAPFSDIWLPSCLGISCLIAISTTLLFGFYLGLAATVTYIVFHLLLYPNWQRGKRRISTSKHLPLFLDALDQASTAGRSIREALDAAVDSLPYGPLKTEFRRLRATGEVEQYLKIVERISGREVKCLVGGLSILLSFGKPSLWQINELKSRVTSMCVNIEERSRRYISLIRITQICAVISLTSWVIAELSPAPFAQLDLVILGQLAILIFVGILGEQVLTE